MSASATIDYDDATHVSDDGHVDRVSSHAQYSRNMGHKQVHLDIPDPDWHTHYKDFDVILFTASGRWYLPPHPSLVLHYDLTAPIASPRYP